MMKKTLNLSIAVLSATLLTSSAMLFAEDGPHDKAIKARQAMFQLYGFNIAILSDMAKGKRDYDATIASEAAATLDVAANIGQSQFWPAGSDNATDGNARTRALPEIWENFADVSEKAEDLKNASAALASVAGNGLEALQGAIGDAGASCKGCHDNYRAERK